MFYLFSCQLLVYNDSTNTNDRWDNIGYTKIKKYLKIIENIDLDIKSGAINDKIIFERFLLEIFKN